MGIRSSIARSKDDLKPFRTKSYAELKDLRIEEIDVVELSKRKEKTDCIRRLLKNEYKQQHAMFCFRMYSSSGITLNQLRDLFDDAGFNVDVAFSSVHDSDSSAVSNVDGYVFPFWKTFTKFIKKHKAEYYLLLTSKLSPGARRLHSRIFHENDNSWYIVTHLDDANWWNFLKPRLLLFSHFTKASGNYVIGHKIMRDVLTELKKDFDKKRRVSVDVESIYQSQVLIGKQVI